MKLMLNRFVTLALLVAAFLPRSTFAQVKTDDIILEAMRDELNRNMSELKLEGYDQPFFMMYGLTDVKQYSVAATLGSLTSSIETTNRYKTTTRLLVGSYEFNDESLDENLISQPTPMEIDLPMDDDYYGIRRSFWSSTDNVYRDAARHFRKNQQTLKETGKELKKIPHRSFAKATPVVSIKKQSLVPWDKSYWETTIRSLSTAFIGHPKILSSRVAISFNQGHKYLVSSEGTLVKTPVSIATFTAFAQMKNEDGEFFFEQISHQARTPDRIPSESELKETIERMIVQIENLATVPKFEDEYTGPVLLLGATVADATMRVFARGSDSPVANDNVQKLTGFQFDQSSGIGNKIGRLLIHESLTLKALPKLTSYNGTELLGSYEIDNEGVVPADEVVLFDKGVLKALMNNRTLTDSTQKANGFSSGPGVLELTCSLKNSEKELKEKLVAKAKQEGLDYAVIVRNNHVNGLPSLTLYKVSLSDGKEEVFRNAYLGQVTLKALKRTLGASSSSSVYNLGAMDFGRNFGGGGVITSLIVPDALLIEELDIRPMRAPSVKEETYVSNPLEASDR